MCFAAFKQGKPILPTDVVDSDDTWVGCSTIPPAKDSLLPMPSVGTLPNGYIQGAPFPNTPICQSALAAQLEHSYEGTVGEKPYCHVPSPLLFLIM